MTLTRRFAAPFRAGWRRLPAVRRLVRQREQLLAENDELQRTVVELETAPDRWVHHHPYRQGCQPASDASTDAVASDDEDHALVERIIDAYGSSLDVDYYGRESWWRNYRGRLVEIHEALAGRDLNAVTQILRSPSESSLLFGYEHFAAEAAVQDPEGWRRDHADRCKDQLLRLAEAIGSLPLENPEGGPWGQTLELPTDEVIDRVEKVLALSLPIAAVQRGFHGITVGTGVITERMIHAAYGSWRIAQLVPDPSTARVLEIGAGLGYTAHYAAQLGVRDYTIVDLPMTNAAQAYFLGRTLGSDRVCLEGEEPGAPGTVKIRTPRAMQDADRPFDLIANIDSLTEVGSDHASQYADRILELAPVFLSINHEANAYTVNELFTARGARIDRFPYWLRVGYVEEIIQPG